MFLRGFVLIVFAFLTLHFFISTAQIVHAQNAVSKENIQTVAEEAGLGSKSADLITLISRIINIVFGMMGLVLLGYILYGGYTWMSAQGDPKKVESAQTILRNAIIGLVIMASSFAIARFIISSLGDVTSEGGVMISDRGGGVGFPGSAGSLGGGIIEYHVPERDATNIPRNTAIVITFKEPIKLASFIKDYNDNGTPANLADDATSSTTVWLNSDIIKIFPTAQPANILKSGDARVRFTADRRTFVIKPTKYLGSSLQKMGYSAELVGGARGILREDGKAAFGGTFSSGYKWQFEVSTIIDNTPPKITAVVPDSGGRYAPNIIVQVHFNEAIDPTSASGLFADNKGFTNLELRAAPISSPEAQSTRPNGTFSIGNHYQTVEFMTDLSCGINTCGKTIYCLPGDSVITVLAKAATLSKTPPEAELTGNGYDGVVDIASNSLDGNGNGTAEGRGKDDFSWSFGTESKPNLTPPRIRLTRPQAGDKINSSNIPVEQTPQADFDSILQTSTLTSDSAKILNNEDPKFADTFWWTPKQILLTAEGRVALPRERVSAGRVSIDHRIYQPAPKDKKIPPPEYDPYLLSDLQNVYQNCFNPAKSATCLTNRNCCDDKPSNKSCQFPVKR